MLVLAPLEAPIVSMESIELSKNSWLLASLRIAVVHGGTSKVNVFGWRRRMSYIYMQVCALFHNSCLPYKWSCLL